MDKDWGVYMIDNLVFSIRATLPIFLLMAGGYLLYLTGLVSRKFARELNSFVFKVALPVQLFVDLADQDIASAWNGKFVLFCFLVTLLSIGIASLLSRLVVRRDPAERGEFIQAAYRSSAAILGVAFIQNIYGDGHTAMAALMMIGAVPLYNIFAVVILSMTAAEGPMTKDLAGEPQKEGEAEGTRTDTGLWKRTFCGIVTNPILLGIAAGLVWSLLRLPMGGILKKTLSDVGRMATPLGLIAMGATFEPRAARERLGSACAAAATKLVLLEALFLPLAVWCGFRGEELVALTVMLGSASTVACYVMATSMGHRGSLSSATVMLTTVGCSFTLAFWLYLLKSLDLI